MRAASLNLARSLSLAARSFGVYKRSPITLELRCPKKVGKVSVDPDPDWSLDDLISDLNSLELKLHGSSMTSALTFIKKQPRARRYEEGVNRSSKPFVMRVSDDEMYDTRSIGEEIPESLVVGGTRFSCSELYLSDSDSSEDEVACEDNRLMVQIEPIEVVLSARDMEYQQDIKEEIRNRVSALERDLMTENERSNSVSVQVQKYKEARREMDKKLDTQYRRRIAEALDNHLIAVQRNHEHRSQLEERKIRNDAAAFEEAKRKEKAIQEEKVWREKAKAETEAAKQRAEDSQKAALDAEETAKKAAEKEVIETAKRVSAEQKLALENKMTAKAEAPKEVRDIGSVVKAAQSALRTEAERLQKYQELDEKNQAILSSNKDLQRYERQIARPIKQIAGTKENVRAKASELIKIINDPMCPQSISINMFAKKVVSQCATSSANFNSTAFACGRVIVLVTSQVPHAMDSLLAEFHRACIYTVPKHVMYSESVLSKEAYYKMMGYHEKDGKIESTEQYLEGVKSYMKLYGALVQTEVDGVQNLHGLKEGWAWLARLLNALPANIYTAVALQAFLEMAGFALCKRYKSQFRKILNVISKHYIEALEARKDPNLNPVIVNIKTYIDTQQFLKEPEGWRLQTTLLSDMGVPEDASDNQNQYHHQNQYYQNPYQNQYHRSYRR